jgi:hypothetical protein
MLGKVKRLITLAMVGCVSLVLATSCAAPSPDTTGTPISSLSTVIPSQPPGSTLSAAPSSKPDPSAPPPGPTGAPQSSLVPVTPIPAPSSQVPAQYSLDAMFDYDAHSLKVSESITYTNLTTETVGLVASPSAPCPGPVVNPYQAMIYRTLSCTSTFLSLSSPMIGWA